MSAASPTTVACRARVAILVMVAALCVVPALVRATFSGSTATPIRLNRGFELPPAKATLAPPPNLAVTPVPRADTELANCDRFPLLLNEIAPISTFERAPDPLRGPPILPLS